MTDKTTKAPEELAALDAPLIGEERVSDMERELAAIAVGKCVEGDDFDPFADPEAFEFASKIADAVLAALPARDARIRREAREAMREEAAKVAADKAQFWRDVTKMGLPMAPSPIINKDRARQCDEIAEAIRAITDAGEPK